MNLHKLMFWKKDDFDFKGLDSTPSFPETGLGADTGLRDPLDPNAGLGMTGSHSSPQPSYPSFQTMPQSPSSMMQPFQSQSPAPSQFISRDFDLIISKLDAIRLSIENISQRLQNLENAVYSEIQQQQPSSYREMPPRTY